MIFGHLEYVPTWDALSPLTSLLHYSSWALTWVRRLGAGIGFQTHLILGRISWQIFLAEYESILGLEFHTIIVDRVCILKDVF